MPEGLRVLEAAARPVRHRPRRIDHFDFASWKYYERHGSMMPRRLEESRIGGHDAIFFGAVGWPEKIPDHVSLWGSLAQVPARLRPLRQPCARARLMPASARRSPARAGRHRHDDRAREHRGRVLEHRRRMFEGTEREVVVQETVMSRRHRPGPEVRVRARAVAAEEALTSATNRTASRSRCRTGTSASRRWRALSPTFASTATTSTSSPRISCSGRRSSTPSSRATCSATS